jgi:hypothetical protein
MKEHENRTPNLLRVTTEQKYLVSSKLCGGSDSAQV